MKKTILTLIAIILATLVARAGFYAAPQINLNPQSPVANLHEASAPVAASPVVNEPSAVAPSPYKGSNFTGTSLRGASRPAVRIAGGSATVSGNILSPRTTFAPTGGGMPVLASAGYSSRGSQSLGGANYGSVSIPHFTIPFAASKVRGGKTAEETHLGGEDITPRQNAVILPGDPDENEQIPINGMWIVMMLLACCYVVTRRRRATTSC